MDEHAASTKRPGDEGADSLTPTEVILLHTKLKIIQEHTEQANKVVLETDEARDDLYNQIEQIEHRLHPKRAHTDDAGDAYEMLAEVDNWDL